MRRATEEADGEGRGDAAPGCQPGTHPDAAPETLGAGPGRIRPGAGERARMLARLVKLDEALENKKWVREATGLDQVPFFYLVASFEEGLAKNPAVPLRYGIDLSGATSQGGYRVLPPVHLLCMMLYHMRTGCPLSALEGVFGVDPSTASRSIAMARHIMAEKGRLPTHKTVASELASASRKEASAVVKGTINMGWLRVEIEKPAGRDAEGAPPGGAGTTTCTALFGCIADGRIILGGRPAEGPISKAAYLRDRLPDAGIVTAALKSADTPAGERIVVNLDGGSRGAAEALPGADVRLPHREPGDGGLAPEQIEYNSRLARERAVIKDNLAAMKEYRILAKVFRGTVDELDETLTVVTGLINLKRFMGSRKGQARGARQERKKAGRSGRRARHASGPQA